MRRNLTHQLKDYDIPYVLKKRDPTASDTGYSVPTDWINTVDQKSFRYMAVGVWKQMSYCGDPIPTTTSTDPATNAAVTTAIVDAYSGVVITLTAAGNAQTIEAPTITTATKKFWVINNDTSSDNIEVNGIVLEPGQSQAFLWDGDAWNVATGIDAEDITFTPTTDIPATDVQGAIVAHKNAHDPEDGDDPIDTAAASEIAGVQAAGTGSAHSFARSDHAHAINHGIADNHLVTIDQADAADDEYARFTADGLESRSIAEQYGRELDF